MAAKKPSKKSTSKKTVDRKAIGKESVEKGKNFEDKVADLYRLLGAKVTQNIEIHHKKVDILVEFSVPGSSFTYKTIVECKNEKKRVNDVERVGFFHSLLIEARKRNLADSAEIITLVPWSDQAKGYAKESGINLVTFQEKISQLIDFAPYIKGLINKFENGDAARPNEPPLGAYYVDLSAQVFDCGEEKEIPVIDTFITAWLEKSDSTKQLAIFGEYGTGKSTFSQKLAYDLAAAYLKNPDKNRIPIVLNLRDFVKKLEIEAFITSFLDRECNVQNPKFNIFKEMNDAGIFLLIFDGLDEMAVKVDEDTLEKNLLEIDKLAAPLNSKVILTSRPEYFINIEEEQHVLKPRFALFATRNTYFEPLKILPWKNEQIAAFLKKRVPLVKEASHDWTYYQKQIKEIDSLSDLSHRPVLLEMIVKTLPQMIKNKIEINLTNLYKTYLAEEIKRQKIAKKRELLLSDANRLKLLEKLAADLYFNIIDSINFRNIRRIVEDVINPPEQELEAYTRDFLTNSFLTRKGDEFVFSHKSIYDYLVAKIIRHEVNSKSVELLGFYRLNYLPEPFLRELESKKDILFDWIYSTRNAAVINYPFLGGNAATLLSTLIPDSLANKDLSETNLTAATLTYANLTAASLKNTILKDANLMSAIFNKQDILSAKLVNTIITLKVTIPPKKIKAKSSRIEIPSYLRRELQVNKNLFKYFPNMRASSIAQFYMTSELNYLKFEITVPENVGIEEICKELSENLSLDVEIYTRDS